MEKKFSITKILSNKKVKIFFIISMLVSAFAALGASTYFSFNKQQAKHIKREKSLAMRQEALRNRPKIHDEKKHVVKIKTKKIDLYDDNYAADPFDISETSSVPNTGLYGSNGLLTAPPLGGIEDSPAGLVMSTTVSGIMYDEASPSAILNIEGSEYFVKINDIINKYKILSIAPKKVVVQYEKNIYQAGVGELLTKVTSNSNIVNLNKKFGGNAYDNIPINIRKQ